MKYIIYYINHSTGKYACIGTTVDLCRLITVCISAIASANTSPYEKSSGNLLWRIDERWWVLIHFVNNHVNTLRMLFSRPPFNCLLSFTTQQICSRRLYHTQQIWIGRLRQTYAKSLYIIVNYWIEFKNIGKYIWGLFYPFLLTTHLLQSTLKPSDQIVEQKTIIECEWKYILTEGEIAHHEQCLLYQQWFQSSSAVDASQCACMMESVYSSLTKTW